MPERNSNLFYVSCTVDPKRQQRIELRNGEERVQGKTTYKGEKLSLIRALPAPSATMQALLNATWIKKHMTGEAFCIICKESYSTTIHGLSEPIDVYNEWIDECERENKFED